MFCRDQMYSSFRAWELVQAAERREGFAFAAVLRARADLARRDAPPVRMQSTSQSSCIGRWGWK